MLHKNERGRLAIVNFSGKNGLVLIINSFFEYLIVCDLSANKINKLRPVALKSDQVKGDKLEMDFYINLFTLRTIKRDSIIRLLGTLGVVKFYQIQCQLEALLLGELGWQRISRRSEGFYSS